MNPRMEPALSIKPTYPGQPLDLEDSFRLVEVQPGKRDDPIHVRLLNTRLEESPAYEALSYTWGDGALTGHIQLFDPTGASAGGMPVTANCHSALNCLRKADSSRTLWIDSICINQSLDPERTQQLGLMSQIYSQASRVVVYLGERAGDSDSVMDWLRDNDEPSEIGRDDDRVEIIRPDKAIVEALLRRPWFSRVWVLQEVALAGEAVVCCGDKEISWESFKTFRHWNVAARLIKDLPYAVEYAAQSPSSSASDTPANRLLKKLVATRHCGATDPRDKLFAILPLMDWETKRSAEKYAGGSRKQSLRDSWKGVNPVQSEENKKTEKDLDRSIVDYGHKPAQVFTDVAIYLLESLGLDVLRKVAGPSAIPQLPSWAPDWSITLKTTPIQPYFTSRTESVFCAGIKNPTEILKRWRISQQIDPSGSNFYQLETPAVKIGTVKMLGDKCEVDKNCFPLTQWESLVPNPELLQSSEKEERLSEFQRLLVFDSVVYPDAVFRGYRKIKKYDKDVIEDGENKKEEHSEYKKSLRFIMKSMPPSYARQAEVMLEACNGRRLVVTDHGNIGLAPDDTKIGDVVFVLEGANVPFVLRTDMSQRLRLVGECYVQGFMKGEAWQHHSDAEELVIC
ncbi:hypothetical protein BP6252_11115 [Neofusicoccum parvum]|nr:hypothetical protein BP6252_11115 [Neofusicoccum parvum]